MLKATSSIHPKPSEKETSTRPTVGGAHPNGEAGKKVFAIPNAATSPVSGLCRLDQLAERDCYCKPLKDYHVAALAESILTLGMLVPLLVDRNDLVIAGRHRLHALRRLCETHPDAFVRLFATGVPVLRVDIDSAIDVEHVLAMETSENSVRDYYGDEYVLALVERLGALGYHVGPGRAQRGRKPPQEFLKSCFGITSAKLRRALPQPTRKPVVDEAKAQHLRKLEEDARAYRLAHPINTDAIHTSVAKLRIPGDEE